MAVDFSKPIELVRHNGDVQDASYLGPIKSLHGEVHIIAVWTDGHEYQFILAADNEGKITDGSAGVFRNKSMKKVIFINIYHVDNGRLVASRIFETEEEALDGVIHHDVNLSFCKTQRIEVDIPA